MLGEIIAVRFWKYQEVLRVALCIISGWYGVCRLCTKLGYLTILFFNNTWRWMCRQYPTFNNNLTYINKRNRNMKWNIKIICYGFFSLCYLRNFHYVFLSSLSRVEYIVLILIFQDQKMNWNRTSFIKRIKTIYPMRRPVIRLGASDSNHMVYPWKTSEGLLEPFE